MGEPLRNRNDAIAAIRRYFEEEAPGDPVGAQARHFAKRSCSSCYGRGTIIKVKAGSQDGDPADLYFCACVRSRILSVADDMVRQKRSHFCV